MHSGMQYGFAPGWDLTSPPHSPNTLCFKGVLFRGMQGSALGPEFEGEREESSLTFTFVHLEPSAVCGHVIVIIKTLSTLFTGR